MDIVRFKIQPESFNRIMNAVQYLYDLCNEDDTMKSVCAACMGDVMNNSSVYDDYIDPETHDVQLINFKCSDSTMRSLLSVIELSPDAYKAGYRRNYAVIMYERFKERHRMKIEQYVEELRELAKEWHRFELENEGDTLSSREAFCEEQGCSKHRLEAALLFEANRSCAKRETVSVELPVADGADVEELAS